MGGERIEEIVTVILVVARLRVMGAGNDTVADCRDRGRARTLLEKRLRQRLSSSKYKIALAIARAMTQ
jgi:hypothetical protein